MSEPSSLYVKIKIKKDNLKKFLLSETQKQKLTPNWEAWWESREMASKTPLTDRDFSHDHTHVYQIIKTWLEYSESFTETKYDLQTETWHFSIYFFSENYYAMLNTLAILCNIAEYRTGDDSDFLIVYPFHWGNGSESPEQTQAYVKFDGNNSKFVLNQVEAADFEAANKYLGARSCILESMYED